MLERLMKWFQGKGGRPARTAEPTGLQELPAQIDRLVKLNSLTERELREQRDQLSAREEELKAQWKTDGDDGRKRDRLVDIKYVRDDKSRLENRLNMLYERGRGLRETRATFQDVAAAKIPSLTSEQIDQIRVTAMDAMRELRETQMAFAQLQGTTSFASNLDASLKELEAELTAPLGQPSPPERVESPGFAEQELQELKRELEGERGRG